MGLPLAPKGGQAPNRTKDAMGGLGMDRIIFTIKVLVAGWIGFIVLAGMAYLLAWLFQQNELAFMIGFGTLFLIVFGWIMANDVR